MENGGERSTTALRLSDDLEDLTNRLEFLLNGSYSLMYLTSTDNGEITRADVSGFSLVSDTILNEFKEIEKKLRNLQK